MTVSFSDFYESKSKGKILYRLAIYVIFIIEVECEIMPADYSFFPEEMENACKMIENGLEEIDMQLEKIDGVANAISDSPNDWEGADADEYIQNIKLYEGDILDLKSTYQSALNALRDTSVVATDRVNETTNQVNRELL